MKYKKIVVTGGSGMVGRSLKKILPDAIYLSSKSYDLTSENGVKRMYSELNPDCVIHLAARVGGIFDNINRPAEYFTQNILMNTLLIEYAMINHVERFIGVLSTCIYPDKAELYPMSEDYLHLGPPTPTNFSYGYAKRSMAVQIDAYNKQYGSKYQYLIPSNMYGEFDKYGDGNGHFIADLIKKIHHAKIHNHNKITLFGDGSPIRQFMYSDDFAEVIKFCLDNDIYENMNVASIDNLTILEMAEIAIHACDASHIKITFDPSKPNGQHRKDVSIDRLKNIFPDFNPLDLYSGIKKTYEAIDKDNLKF